MPSGYLPAIITIEAGQSIHWTNRSTLTETITADNGLFDSGPVPPGAGFSIALAVPGVHTYHSDTSPGFSGEIRVVLVGLAGPPDDLANDHIPYIPFPPSEVSDLSPDPQFSILSSRTRVLIGFTPNTTVAQANAALSAAGVTIIGGLPKFGTLLAITPDAPDFSPLVDALRLLRANPTVDFASRDEVVAPRAIPLPVESNLYENTTGWQWHTPSEKLYGDGGNWDLEASKFPQAWNLIEPIRKKQPSVSTAILDYGFEQHADLPNLNYEKVCNSNIFPPFARCSATDLVHQHGNLVAGIIGASYDNPLLTERARSLGVSGANPFARMYGISLGLEPTPLSLEDFDELVSAGDTMNVFDWALNDVPSLRVINYSAGIELPEPDYWWEEHPISNRICGPGDHDDGTIFHYYCTPNNEDRWLQDQANRGKRAHRIAEGASRLGVIIVQSVGNRAEEFTPGGLERTLIRAQNDTEFSWARRWKRMARSKMN